MSTPNKRQPLEGIRTVSVLEKIGEVKASIQVVETEAEQKKGESLDAFQVVQKTLAVEKAEETEALNGRAAALEQDVHADIDPKQEELSAEQARIEKLIEELLAQKEEILNSQTDLEVERLEKIEGIKTELKTALQDVFNSVAQREREAQLAMAAAIEEQNKRLSAVKLEGISAVFSEVLAHFRKGGVLLKAEVVRFGTGVKEAIEAFKTGYRKAPEVTIPEDLQSPSKAPESAGKPPAGPAL